MIMSVIFVFMVMIRDFDDNYIYDRNDYDKEMLQVCCKYDCQYSSDDQVGRLVKMLCRDRSCVVLQVYSCFRPFCLLFICFIILGIFHFTSVCLFCDKFNS